MPTFSSNNGLAPDAMGRMGLALASWVGVGEVISGVQWFGVLSWKEAAAMWLDNQDLSQLAIDAA